MVKQKIGAWGESLASNYLKDRGYKILKQNIRLGNQELDIVCLFQNKLIIAEVKTKMKSVFSKPEDMIGRSKIKNLKYASYKLLKLLHVKASDLRFDLLALEVDRVAKIVKIRHYKDII